MSKRTENPIREQARKYKDPRKRNWLDKLREQAPELYDTTIKEVDLYLDGKLFTEYDCDSALARSIRRCIPEHIRPADTQMIRRYISLRRQDRG